MGADGTGGGGDKTSLVFIINVGHEYNYKTEYIYREPNTSAEITANQSTYTIKYKNSSGAYASYIRLLMLEY